MLDLLAAHARTTRLGVVLDEFSYYVDETPGLPSLVQRWWDRQAQDTRVFFVLADSHVTFVDRLVASDQPLYGRRTHDLRVRPFDYADAARFFPTYSADDRIRDYGVLGGMPAYLSVVDPIRSLADNLQDVVLADAAAPRREPDYLFAQERSIRDPVRFRSVLRAVAEQHTQPNEIAQAAGYQIGADVSLVLERLQGMNLVERITPTPGRSGGRISRYVISDNFLAFWFRFVQPAEGLLDRGLGWLILADLFSDDARRLNEFVSRPQGPWEEAGRSYLWRAQRAVRLSGTRFDTLGCWWEGRGATDSAEVDIVGLDGQRISLVGSCKWRRAFTKLGDLYELHALARRIGADNDTRHALFSRASFDPNLVKVAPAASVLLVTPEDMFDPVILDP